MKVIPIIWLHKEILKGYIDCGLILEPIPGYKPVLTSFDTELKPYRITFDPNEYYSPENSIDQADIGNFQLNFEYIRKLGQIHKDIMLQMIDKVIETNKDKYKYFLSDIRDDTGVIYLVCMTSSDTMKLVRKDEAWCDVSNYILY